MTPPSGAAARSEPLDHKEIVAAPRTLVLVGNPNVGKSVLFGALTITGSFMAFGKLQELLPGRPITFRGQNVVSIGLFLAGVGLMAFLVAFFSRPDYQILPLR